MFKSIKNTYKKSEAAVIVQNLIEMQIESSNLFIPTPKGLSAQKTAKTIIQEAWDFKPKLFSGGFGTRPHKLIVAFYAIAFAIASNYLKCKEPDDFQLMCIRIFMVINNEIDVNGPLYSFSETDYTLIKMGFDIYFKVIDETLAQPE